MKLEQRTGWGSLVAIVVAIACNVGDEGSPDFSSHGGTAVSADAGDAADGDADGDGDDDADGDGDGATPSTSGDDGGTSGGVTDPDGSSDDQGSATTASLTTGNDDASGDGMSTDGSTDGGGSSSEGGESSSDGGMPASAYEPCNPDNTCDTPGEICLQVGAGGFCTTTCVNDAQCPAAPGGATPAACEFLLGFPDFGSDYCGMITCGWPLNNCPAGMACTPVVQGLQVCEWL